MEWTGFMVTYGPAGDRLRANRVATPRPRSSNSVTPACHLTSYTGMWESPAPQGTNSRKGWRALNARLCPGDVLVVAAVDRIGRRWMDTVSALRDLRGRQVRVRSLGPSEQHWTRYFDADPDLPEAVIGDVLASFFT